MRAEPLDRPASIATRRDLEHALARAEEGGAARRRVALDAVRSILFRLDVAELGTKLVARALAAGVPREELDAATSRPPHAVLVPFAIDGQSDRAWLRTVYVSLDPGGTGEGALALEPDAERAVARALTEARRLAGWSASGVFRLVAARPESVAGASVRGSSLAAAALVSAVALATGRAVAPDVAVTGGVEGSCVTAVGAIASKVRAAVAMGAQAIVVPADDADEAARAARGRISVLGVSSTAALLAQALSASVSPSDLDDLVERALAAARHGWRGYRWAEARELLERALALVPAGAVDRRLDLYARFAAAERHLGAHGRSARILAEARALLASARGRGAVPHDVRSRVEQQLAMTALSEARFAEAERVARAAVRSAREAASRREEIKALGCLGLVAIARGRPQRARVAFEVALGLGLGIAPDDAARSRAYLVGALAAAGDLRGAARHYRLALSEAQREGSRPKEAWVRTAWGGALVSAGRLRDAVDVLDAPTVRDAIARTPLPGVLARRHLGRALLGRPATRARGLSLLLAPVGEPAEPGALLALDVNAWMALAELARRGPLGAAERARLEASLDRVPVGALARFLGPAARRARRAAHGADACALAAALDALAERASRLV